MSATADRASLRFDVRRASQRFSTGQPGITTRHCFSAGAHYEPDNVGFGPLVGCDEHQVAAGAGFPRHRHAGVTIVSWPLSGLIRHVDAEGTATDVPPGFSQVLVTGAGVEHAEFAAAPAAARFVQLAVVGSVGAPRYRRRPAPPGAVAVIATAATPLGDAVLRIVRPPATSIQRPAGRRWFLYVTRPTTTLRALGYGSVELAGGDSVRITADGPAELTFTTSTDGPDQPEVLLWELP